MRSMIWMRTEQHKSQHVKFRYWPASRQPTDRWISWLKTIFDRQFWFSPSVPLKRQNCKQTQAYTYSTSWNDVPIPNDTQLLLSKCLAMLCLVSFAHPCIFATFFVCTANSNGKRPKCHCVGLNFICWIRQKTNGPQNILVYLS